MMRRRLHLILIPLAAALCIVPLLLNGCSCGHDFDFHLLNWLEAASQISSGNLHPHWAYTPAFGAGEPRFVFYPPLSWAIGALLTLLARHLPHIDPARAFTAVPIAFTWIALCAAGLTMHSLLRRYTPPLAALICATLYLANPYTLFTAFERTAFAELLAAAWIPLLLLAILPPPPTQASPSPSPDNVPIPSLALAVALLWLTNAPAAVMGCYALAILAAVRLLLLYRKTRSLRPLLRPAVQILAGTTLGLALPAFYLLPAAYERRWVQISMAIIPSMRIQDNTLFHHTGDPFHDAVLHTASLLAVLLLALTGLALLYAHRHRPSRPSAAPQLLPLAVLAAAIALLLTPLSAPLWRYVPELAFLQFPWRTLALLAAVLALALGLALRSATLRAPVAIAATLLLPAALTLAAYLNFHQPCDPGDTPPAQLALFHSGAAAEPTDEYTPTTADNDSLQQLDPPYFLLPPAKDPGSPAPQTSQHAPAPDHLDLNLPTPETLVLNRRDFPAWRVTRNGTPIRERLQRDDGLIAISLPAGPSRIDLAYTRTPDETLGDAISALALCLLAPVVYAARRKRTHPGD